MNARQRPSESVDQRALVEWMDLKGIRYFSVPNGFIAGGMNKWAMLARLRAEGMKAGAPDLILVDRANTDGMPVAVEMKRLRGGQLSPEQVAMLAAMRTAGWHIIIAPGLQSAITQLEELGF